MHEYSILFFINREKGKEDASLRVRVKWSGNECTTNVGYRINPERWDSELHRCVPKSYHGRQKFSSATINRRISEIEERVSNLFSEARIPDREAVRRAVRDEPEKAGMKFLDAIDLYIKESSIENSWTIGTVENMTTTRNYIDEFNRPINLEDLNYGYMMSFLQWMYDKNFTNVYIKNRINIIRGMIRWMKKRNLYSGNVLEEFNPKIKIIERDVIYLTWDELNRMMNVKVNNRFEEVSRDGFLLQCFTGIRYSDLKSLKKSDVFKDHISVTTIKTDDPILIDLNKFSMAILDKYKDSPGEYVIKIGSNVAMNKNLKKLAERAGINTIVNMSLYKGSKRVEVSKPKYELITTHCGRRTFVVNAMHLNISDSVIMSWTGHSSVEAMRPYRKVIDESKKRDMAKFDTLGVTGVTKKL